MTEVFALNRATLCSRLFQYARRVRSMMSLFLTIGS